MGVAGIPAAPLLLTFILTPMLEGYVRQAFDISRGSLSIFIGNNIARSAVGSDDYLLPIANSGKTLCRSARQRTVRHRPRERPAASERVVE